MQDHSEEEPQNLEATPYQNEESGSPSSDKFEKGSNSQERLSRSKMLYEADAEDYELRKKLLESKVARKKTEEDAKILMNRLLLLKNEEQKVKLGGMRVGVEEDRGDKEEGGGDNKDAGEKPRAPAQTRGSNCAGQSIEKTAAGRGGEEESGRDKTPKGTGEVKARTDQAEAAESESGKSKHGATREDCMSVLTC
eukprot:TRINITY_DN16490_c0_g3_i8.p2 TRINITY_DN16490_c0_g3~~TRINITY_DN16490_c0_g3_i8.p2  ORF type:complete len:195 (+),score=57.81 TRINITY_DN16490_c0_g3_i8:162-746(+)